LAEQKNFALGNGDPAHPFWAEFAREIWRLAKKAIFVNLITANENSRIS
jgi:hypothetical protein